MCSGRMLLWLVRIENKTRSTILSVCHGVAVLSARAEQQSFDIVAVTSAAAESRDSVRVSYAVWWKEVLLQTIRDDVRHAE